MESSKQPETGTVQIGVVYPQTELRGDPSAVRRIGRAVEDLGFDHLLAYDHVLGAVQADRTPPLTGPYTEHDPFHDPLVMFAYLAAVTERIGFATGVLVLPQRQTALVARQAADVDLLSGGRLRLGVGVGWNHAEYEALGQDFRTRGARQQEQIELLRRLFTGPVVDFSGRFHRVDRAALVPKPARPIPIWLGGSGDAAFERAAAPYNGTASGDSRLGTAGVPPPAVRMSGPDSVAGGWKTCHVPRRTWLDSKIDVFLEELAAAGMHLDRQRAGELITGQVRAVATLLRVTGATARTYLDDEIIKDMARRMLFEVAGERPGADLMEAPRTVPLPLALVGITVAALAEAMQVRAANEPPGHLRDVITTYAQTLSGLGQITAGTAPRQAGNPAEVLFPPALLRRAARYISGAADLAADGGKLPDGIPETARSQLAATLRRDADGLIAITTTG